VLTPVDNLVATPVHMALVRDLTTNFDFDILATATATADFIMAAKAAAHLPDCFVS